MLPHLIKEFFNNFGYVVEFTFEKWPPISDFFKVFALIRDVHSDNES